MRSRSDGGKSSDRPVETSPALSSGCFIGYEDRLTGAAPEAIELSSHRPASLERILTALRDARVRIVGVHAPCPNRGVVPDLAASGDRWTAVVECLHEAMEVAAAVRADYVVVHAFYCTDRMLPSDDVERMSALRDAAAAPAGSMIEYVRSERYCEAKRRATCNLQSILPDLRARFPGQRLVLENLNPRELYGGIELRDLAEVAEAGGGEVGACLDVGHLALSAATLGFDPAEGLEAVRELVAVAHVHQNFAGAHFADRHWSELEPREGFQEVDTHLPLLTTYRSSLASEAWGVAPENAAFRDLMVGPARYAPDGGGDLRGAVPVSRILARLGSDVRPVLEMDSRLAPLDEILREYELARRGAHPGLDA